MLANFLRPGDVLILSLIVGVAPAVRAEDRACCRDRVCSCITHSQNRQWQIAETNNFRIHYRRGSLSIETIASACEEHRVAMRRRWLGDDTITAWSPKCDVFLYPTGSEFQRATRYPAEGMGFADLEIGEGKVWNRILQMRADDPAKMMPVLLHELTHVVLADRFLRTRIPCWADEGIAVLSEPPERHRKLQTWLSSEVRRGRKYSLRSLTRLSQFPPNRYQSDLLYAQSGALVAYLTEEHGLAGHELLALVERIERTSWDAAVGERFPHMTSAQLETDWHDWLTREAIGAE